MARPSRYPIRIEVFIDAATRDGLTAAALRAGRPVADVVRRAIAYELGRVSPNSPGNADEGK